VKFEDSFDVPVGLPEAWNALTDIERVYPCLPGAQLSEISDNEFHGLVTLKLGPITASYKGIARFESLDRDNARLVIHAEGRDRHGQGTARARVSAALIAEGDARTRVDMVNEVDITGKAAQFGRGILTDVSKEIMAQFADNLRGVIRASQNDNDASGDPTEAQTEVPAEAAALDAGSVIRSVGARRLQEQPVSTVAVIGALLILGLIAFRAVFGRRRNRVPTS
jgi:uncharacterized protein